ncbi:MSP (Major sperm protein) domain-containing protein [Ditylenchus destructor]|uniref:Major sperm protein n=1 Tax=Ditylenchus destructor TaxID=166010 RepID=A0AAD4N1D2_9BILA|nr:MSP (Major sperm protein) domain-containing protein [Ditylenchus destructor]
MDNTVDVEVVNGDGTKVNITVPAATKRVVSFKDDDEHFTSPEASSSSEVTSPGRAHISSTASSISEDNDDNNEFGRDQSAKENRFLEIVPSDELTLLPYPNGNSNSSHLSGILTVQNRRPDANVLFKVKTTSPEKFRVRPSIGTIGPGGVQTIQITLQKEYRNSFRAERFLLVAVSTSEPNIKEFNRIYGEALEGDKMQAKIGCRITDSSKKKEENVSNSTNEKPTIKKDLAVLLAERELSMHRQMNDIRQQLSLLKIVVLFLILFQVFSFIFLLTQMDWFAAERHQQAAKPSAKNVEL